MQLDLLSAKPSLPVSDPSAPAAERPRLTRQAREVLARLQAGPATRRQLGEIALNVTARVSDLRRCGYAVDVIERHDDGLTIYALREDR